MNKEILKSINRIINYIYLDEEKHFEESKKPRNHIFRDLKKVKQYLERKKI